MKIFCISLMGEIGTSLIETGDVAIDPSPDEDYCPRGLDVERALALELGPEEHFGLFETNFLNRVNSD